MSKTKNDEAIIEAIDLLVDKGVDLSKVLNEGGILKQLTKRLVERALESEMKEHLGYERYNRSDSENARNGVSQKNIATNNGVVTVEVPRDRKAEFEPAI